MSRNLARRAIVTLGLLIGLAAPATASAWTVTVHVHGAGLVDEITDRNLMHCTVGPIGIANATVTDCVAGSPNGVYNSFDIIELAAVVPAAHFNRGWRFSHWQDSTAGGAKINCDETGGPGQPPDTNCRFQIFQNLEVDLFFTDGAGPEDTTLSGGPAQGTRTNSTSASFTFNSPSESLDARYECRLDPPGTATGSYFDCGTPDDKGETFSGLTDGPYELSVRAKDPSGHVDPTPVTRSWFVDTEAPTATITGTPANGAVTNSTSANFSVTSDEAGTIVCTLDNVVVGCGLSRTNIPPGTHTFTARATDQAGNVGPLATRTWTVDLTPPVVTLNGDPAAGDTTNQTSVDLTATTNEGTLACTLNGAPAACVLDTTVGEGSHTFAATATDSAGNVATATRTWTVDVTPPVITFTGGPANGATVNEGSANFSYSANEAGSDFECSLDSETEFAPCGALTGLSDGPHTFRVRMTDTAGNRTTAARTWTIDTAVPDTTLLGGPAEGSTAASGDATFEFASPESGATFECRLDGAAFAACTSPSKLTGVSDGDHVFEVRARDAAGNVDATPARRAWRVNSLDGDGDGANRPADCDDANAAVRPGATDTPGDGIDQDCAGGDAAVAVEEKPNVTPPAKVTTAALSKKFRVRGARTRIVRLALSKIAVGATVKLTCRGRGCPVRSRTVRPSTTTVDVRALLRRRPMRAGTTLTLTITQPGHIGRVVSFRFRRGKAPRGGAFRCLVPGTTTPSACPA